MDIKELIKNKNIKLTPARESILNIFINANKPLCYEDIKNDISMDKATFYRNIIKFEENDILNSFESNNKKRYFEIQKKSHAHFICTICNSVECIDKSISLALSGYKVENIIIQGSCKNCTKKNIN